jgi:hypothetical protein
MGGDPLLARVRLTHASALAMNARHSLDELPADECVDMLLDVLMVADDLIRELKAEIQEPGRRAQANLAAERLGLNAKSDAKWSGFLSEHPELHDGKTAKQEVPLDVAALDDDAIMRAVDEVVRQWTEYDGRVKEAVAAYEVACVLAGADSIEGRRGLEVARGDVIRIGQRLGKLKRAGRLMLVGHGFTGEPRRYTVA